MKKEFLLSLNDIDESYLEDARPKVKKKTALPRLVIAASILLVGATILTFALLGGKGGNDPIVPTPDDSTGTLIPPEDTIPNNPFDDGYGDYSRLMAAINKYQESYEDYYFDMDDGVVDEGAQLKPGSPDYGLGDSSTPSNGNVIENTDNQVSGVIEGDLMKMTDKYIFRFGEERNGAGGDKRYYLRIYSVDKENSRLITNYHLPMFNNELSRYRNEEAEIYLSEDAKTLTIIRTYVFKNDQNYTSSAVGVMSFDISDVNNIKEKARVSINGGYISSRMVDGRLLLLTNQYFYVEKDTDMSNPTDFVPEVNVRDEIYSINPECICIPDNIGSVNYSTLLMLGEGELDVVDVRSFLDYSEKDAYVSKDNIFLIRDYQNCTDGDDGKKNYEAMSDISIIGYNKNGFTDKGQVAIPGTVNNQYSLDERNGHLRVVTTTILREQTGEKWWNRITATNASLFVINLSDNSIRASVEGFAPDGEEVASVRFEGDKLYVCTAVIRLFSDPVFFFDLSDYDNITYTDTGYIEGFSSSLIDLGEGYLLGIGKEDTVTNKIEVYKKENGAVVSVDKYLFKGSYSTEYKSYLINRDQNLFGLGVLKTVYNEQTLKYENSYLLFAFDGEKLNVVESVSVVDLNPSMVRAAIVDGYLYITTTESLVVEKL